MLSEADIKVIYNIMTEAFPLEERRSYAGQLAVTANPYYRLVVKRNTGGEIIAFLAVWAFVDFSFIEHLAVHKSRRSSGLGGKLLSEYLQESRQPVLLEVEPPVSPLQRRRVRFYERYGFHLNEFEYLQPPYEQGKEFIELKIMSYPGILTASEFRFWIEMVYREVYGQ